MLSRHRLFLMLDGLVEGDRLAAAFDLAMNTLILANVTAIVVETVPSLRIGNEAWFNGFERASLLVFVIEYLLRMWACGTDPRYHGLRGRIRYAMRPLNLIDLLAILPGVLSMHADGRMLRGLRILRVLRVLKLSRYSRSIQTFGRVLRKVGPELLSALFVLMLMLVLASSLMFVLERDINPQFSSIPAAMWWGIATFTTVGYGDITPITPLGRVLGGVVAILGIAMFAIPAGLVGAAFTEEWRRQREEHTE